MFTKNNGSGFFKTSSANGFAHQQEVESEESTRQFIPYEAVVDDNTIALHNGELMQTIVIKGIAFRAESEDHLNSLTNKINNSLRSIADPRITIWHNAIKRRVDTKVEGDFTNSYVKRFHKRYDQNLKNKNHYELTHYLTVVIRNPNSKALSVLELVASLADKGLGRENSVQKTKHQDLIKSVSTMLAILKPFSPRLLGTKKVGKIRYSEPLSLLWRLANGFDKDIPLNDKIIKTYISCSRPIFKKSYGTLHHHANRTKYFTSFSVKERMCIETSSDDLHGLLELQAEFVMTQTFEFQSKMESLDDIARQQRVLESVGDKAVSEIDEIDEAMDDLASRKSVFGLTHQELLVYVEDKNDIVSISRDAEQVFDKANFLVVRDDIVLEAKFWCQLPGNFRYRTRVVRTSSENFADWVALHTDTVTTRETYEWGITPHSDSFITASTIHNTPFRLNIHIGDKANTCVVGNTGSGKTVILMSIAMAMNKYDGRVFFFDKNRGAEIGIRAMAGRYQNIQPGIKTGFNPCKLPDTPQNRFYLNKLLVMLLSAHGELNARDLKDIGDAVDSNYQFEPEHRVLRNLDSLLPKGDEDHLSLRLSRWINNGINAWLFDNEHDDLDIDNRYNGFDLTDILDEEELRGPTMSYLIHRVKEGLTGDPAAIIIDEGWKGLRDEHFAEQLESWELEIRKISGAVVFATQFPTHLEGSKAGAAVVSQSVTKLFGYNKEANKEEYQRVFTSLSDAEFEVIKKLEERQWLYKRGEISEVITIDYRGMERDLYVISGRKITVKILGDVMKENGNDPDNWLPHFDTACESLRG